MTNLVIIVALETELKPGALPPSIPLIYSGMGKINSALAVFKAIQEYQPKQIINYGTAGKINPNLSGLLQIKKVIQRDMIPGSLAPRGIVPFSDIPNEFYCQSGQYVCGTGDSFVQDKDDWLIENQVDVVDMELFAIASVAHAYNCI
jgi:adenosylhomocysteine nucleosidase